jgi:sortase A
MKGKATTVILVIVFFIGLSLLLYPSVSNWWNSFHQTRAVFSYADTVSKIDSGEYRHYIDEALAYNERLAERGIQWQMSDLERSEYEACLNVDDTGSMGYIDIPKIRVMLPLYHGTEEAVLQTSIGHIEFTSLPIGGTSSHCVVSGHRGLPSAKLFSDLDKLTYGDQFTLNILNETLTYEVDQITVVEPADVDSLQIEEGQDYCTLLTCTPYGINTHRMLVRGRRVANKDGGAKVLADALQIEPKYIAPFLAVPVLLILAVLTSIASDRRAKRRKKKEELLQAAAAAVDSLKETAE